MNLLNDLLRKARTCADDSGYSNVDFFFFPFLI